MVNCKHSDTMGKVIQGYKKTHTVTTPETHNTVLGQKGYSEYTKNNALKRNTSLKNPYVQHDIVLTDIEIRTGKLKGKGSDR